MGVSRVANGCEKETGHLLSTSRRLVVNYSTVGGDDGKRELAMALELAAWNASPSVPNNYPKTANTRVSV